MIQKVVGLGRRSTCGAQIEAYGLSHTTTSQQRYCHPGEGLGQTHCGIGIALDKNRHLKGVPEISAVSPDDDVRVRANQSSELNPRSGIILIRSILKGARFSIPAYKNIFDVQSAIVVD